MLDETLTRQARAIWDAGIRAVDGCSLVCGSLSVDASRRLLLVGGTECPAAIPLDRLRRIIVIGGGKAAGAMAKGVEASFDRWAREHCELFNSIELLGRVNVPDEVAAAVSSGAAIPGKMPWGKLHSWECVRLLTIYRPVELLNRQRTCCACSKRRGRVIWSWL